MSVLEVIVLVVIAAVCGSLGMAISGYSRGGCFLAIALGFIGALLGVWIARQMDLPELFTIDIGGVQFPIIWSIIGSAIFVAVLSFIARVGTREP